jgi:hypothetical protein
VQSCKLYEKYLGEEKILTSKTTTVTVAVTVTEK